MPLSLTVEGGPGGRRGGKGICSGPHKRHYQPCLMLGGNSYRTIETVGCEKSCCIVVFLAHAVVFRCIDAVEHVNNLSLPFGRSVLADGPVRMVQNGSN
eukprot:2164647-Amphidinium_carterae.2